MDVAEALADYVRAVGRRWYAIVFSFAFGLLGAGREMNVIPEIWAPLPTWVFWTLAVIALCGAQFWAYFEIWAANRKPKIYDVSVLGFLALGPKYKWDFEKSEGFLYLDMQDALLDGAANGLITVWGRRVSGQMFKSLPYATPLVAIPQEYWANKASVVLPLQMNGVMGKDNGEASGLQNADDATRYRDLHLAKSEALRWMRTHGYRFRGLQRADRDRRAERNG